MRQEDLRVRRELDLAGRLFRGYDAAMEAVHRSNAARLREIVAEHGWPTPGLVGDDGAEAAWLVAQHAIGDPEVQRHSLTLLQQKAEGGEVPAWQAAYLVDRIRMYEGWPQVYGTQSVPEVAGGDRHWPIANAAAVDDRRKAVGLPPLKPCAAAPAGGLTASEQLARRNLQIDGDAWARRVGWRTRILHLATVDAWRDAVRKGAYTSDSLTTEGFIHCSEPQQAIWVANDRFRGRHDLMMLQIRVNLLPVPLRYENLEGGDELFPHVYGPLPLDAIVRCDPFPSRPDGSFDHDQLAVLY